jgi:class 3 adenylate cyclase
MEVPDTHYARVGELRIAFQEFGEGERTVFIPPFVSNIDVMWDHECPRRMLEHLGSFLRLVAFDKRGIGLSDRFEEQPTLDERIDDIEAVMDAVGWETAHMLGLSEGAAMAQHYAVQHPGRVHKLALLSAQAPLADAEWARELSGDAHRDVAEILADFSEVAQTWGEDPRPYARLIAPSQVGNDAYLRWINRMNRLSASPADFARQLMSIVSIAGTTEPERVRAETIVVHLTGDRCVPIGNGRVLAERIPNSRLVEVEGADHLLYSLDNWRDVVDPVIEFFTGVRPPLSVQRRFAAIMLTDIVGSTAMASSMGDVRWRELIERHAHITHRVFSSNGGRVVKSTGDGALALFETPSDAVGAASSLRAALDDVGLAIRAGIHAGEVEEHADGDISGLAVNLAARVEQAASDGAIYVSSTMKQLLLGGRFELADRGAHTLKGFEGTWPLFEVR